ncbi:hypothetical protein D9M68_705510 [compost metagenome]
MRRPVGDAFAVDEQVVVDLLIQRQGALQAQVDQMQEGLPPHGDHPAGVPVQGVFDATVQGQPQHRRQRARGHQPEHQAPGFDAAQQGAGEDGRERDCGHRREGPSTKRAQQDTAPGRVR